jgi:hypothetical protein
VATLTNGQVLAASATPADTRMRDAFNSLLGLVLVVDPACS